MKASLVSEECRSANTQQLVHVWEHLLISPVPASEAANEAARQAPSHGEHYPQVVLVKPQHPVEIIYWFYRLCHTY